MWYPTYLKIDPPNPELPGEVLQVEVVVGDPPGGVATQVVNDEAVAAHVGHVGEGVAAGFGGDVDGEVGEVGAGTEDGLLEDVAADYAVRFQVDDEEGGRLEAGGVA